MTVLNNDGLVGRVVRGSPAPPRRWCWSSTPTRSSAAGSAPAWRSAPCRGRGNTGGSGRLDLDLVDDSVVAGRDDTVVTWGSETARRTSPGSRSAGSPRSTAAPARPRAGRGRAAGRLRSLDLVGVVVPGASTRGRGVEADGKARDPVDASTARTGVLPFGPSPRSGRRPRPGPPGLAVPAPRLAGIVPNLCLLVVVGAALNPRPAVRGRPRLRGRGHSRPRAARRPRRRPLGARTGDRRVRRRPGAPGRQADRPRGRRDRGRVVVRRHLGVRAHRPAAARPRPVASPTCSR